MRDDFNLRLEQFKARHPVTEERELENERMIYGSSFLHIKRAEDFGGSAGKRLRETLMLL